MHARPIRNERRTRTTYGSRRASARIMEASIAMQFQSRRSLWRHGAPVALMAALALLAPASARAQYGAPDMSSSAIGENYHFEVSGNFWNPDLFGQISSEQFGLIGSQIDFLTDLG